MFRARLKGAAYLCNHYNFNLNDIDKLSVEEYEIYLEYRHDDLKQN